jgi:hypothetical protein
LRPCIVVEAIRVDHRQGWEGVSMKKIVVRKAGSVRLTSAAHALYEPGCVVVA